MSKVHGHKPKPAPTPGRQASQVRNQIKRAVVDGRVTNTEAAKIEKLAKQNRVRAAEKKVIGQALLNNLDSFDPRAQKRFDKLSGHKLTKTRLEDPAVMNAHTGTGYGFSFGRIFKHGISPNDIKQGAAGDCYFLASMAAVAHSRPDLIQDMIRPNKDGTVTVLFYGPDGQRVPVTVDRDLAAKGNLYANASMGELWPALLEKAYAKFRGNFETIGNGGYAKDALFALTGQQASWNYTNGQDPNAVFAGIAGALGAGKNAVVYTSASEEKYVNSGLVPHHAYTILGVYEQNGEKYVQLRNPWGYQEFGKDGRDDGTFSMTMSQFTQWFDGYDA